MPSRDPLRRLPLGHQEVGDDEWSLLLRSWRTLMFARGRTPKAGQGIGGQWRSPAVLKLYQHADFPQLTHHVFDHDQSETVPSYRSF